MNLLVISDTHLTQRFVPKKYQFLKRIITGADRVILNGDFWDSYLCSFSAFVRSPWKQIFPLLLKKKAIYLYGNHDPQKESDDRVRLFSNKTGDTHREKIGGTTYHFQHGHLIAPSPEMRYAWLLRNPVAMHANNLLNIIGVHASANTYLYLKNNADNIKAKHWAGDRVRPGHIHVIGHTHLQEVDYDAGIAISGFIGHGYASYLTISDSGITQHTDRY